MRHESLDITGDSNEYQLKLSSFFRSVARSSDPMLADKFADHPLSAGSDTALLAVVFIIHILMMAGCAGMPGSAGTVRRVSLVSC